MPSVFRPCYRALPWPDVPVALCTAAGGPRAGGGHIAAGTVALVNYPPPPTMNRMALSLMMRASLALRQPDVHFSLF